MVHHCADCSKKDSCGLYKAGVVMKNGEISSKVVHPEVIREIIMEEQDPIRKLMFIDLLMSVIRDQMLEKQNKKRDTGKKMKVEWVDKHE